MTENKQFKLHIEWYNKKKTEGKFVLKDGGQPLGVIESIEDARLIRDTLNDLFNENEQLKKENEQLKDILKDIIIQLDADYTMNAYQMVVPISRVIYNELSRRLKETSFNEELRRFLE